MNLTSLSGLLALAVVFVAVPLKWVVTLLLWRLLRKSPDNRVLRYQVLVGITLTLIVTIFALIFVNNDMPAPLLNVEQTKLVTRSAMLALVLPALYWLALYRRAS